MLTRKQRDLLLFIHERLRHDDVPPSFEEMKIALGLKSKSGIHRLISGLEERGYIERLPHRARALEIKKLPEGFKQPQEQVSFGAIEQQAVANMNTIPLLGKIAAGTPIEAITNQGQTIHVSQDLTGLGEHYALTIEGDSMINAGIHDSDVVIIKQCDSAEDGAIVVALVDDQEATLKTLRREDGMIILQPENETHSPQILAPERVKIQGRLVSLMRTYH